MIPFEIVNDPFASDAPHNLPVARKEEFKNILNNFSAGRSVKYDLKKLIEKYPDTFSTAAFLLTTFYLKDKDRTRAKEWNEKVLAVNPENVFAICLKARLMMEEEQYDELEEWKDFSLTFAEQFPARKKVEMDELLHYEVRAITWLIINEETDEAIERTWKLMPYLAEKANDPKYAAEILQQFSDYISAAEVTPQLTELRYSLGRLIYSLTPLQRLNHAEMIVLLSEFEEEDVSKVLPLLTLPKDTMVQDLYTIVDDVLQFTDYYKEGFEFAKDQLWLSMLILASTKDGGAWEKWLMLMQQDELFIEDWFTDFLMEEMFVVGYQLSDGDINQLGQAILRKRPYVWCSVCLSLSLLAIAWVDPSRKAAVVDKFEEIIRTLFKVHPYDLDDYNTILLTRLLDQAIELDKSRFVPYLIRAKEEDRLDMSMMPSFEEVMAADPAESSVHVVVEKFTESISDKMKRIFKKWF